MPNEHDHDPGNDSDSTTTLQATNNTNTTSITRDREREPPGSSRSSICSDTTTTSPIDSLASTSTPASTPATATPPKLDPSPPSYTSSSTPTTGTSSQKQKQKHKQPKPPKPIPLVDRMFFPEMVTTQSYRDSMPPQQQTATAFYGTPSNETLEAYSKGAMGALGAMGAAAAAAVATAAGAGMMMQTPPITNALEGLDINSNLEEQDYQTARILYGMYLQETAGKIRGGSSNSNNRETAPVQALPPGPIPAPEQAHTRGYTSPRAIYRPEDRRPGMYSWGVPPGSSMGMTEYGGQVGIEYSEFGQARLMHRPYPGIDSGSGQGGQGQMPLEERHRLWSEQQWRQWGYPPR